LNPARILLTLRAVFPSGEILGSVA
jgi:hypothetical protein